MSTKISFRAKIRVGSQSIPVLTEVVAGDTDSQDGVSNGFLFKLDEPADSSGLIIYLGDLVTFMEAELGINTSDSGGDTTDVSDALGIDPNDLTPDNQTLVIVKEFTLNSSSQKKLFAFNVDIAGSDPDTGLIAFPAEINNWLKIDDLALAFDASSTSTGGGT